VTIRTTVKTVRFTQPFRLSGIDDVQPPGEYDVTTDEEQIDSMTQIAWHRVATTILLSRGGTSQSYPINPVDLEASLMRDAGLTVPPPPERDAVS
jgi:hypothetical protein